MQIFKLAVEWYKKLKNYTLALEGYSGGYTFLHTYTYLHTLTHLLGEERVWVKQAKKY